MTHFLLKKKNNLVDVSPNWNIANYDSWKSNNKELSVPCVLKTKLSSYYGNTNFNYIDTESNYYKDVEKTIEIAKDKLKNHPLLQSHDVAKGLIRPAIMFDLDDTIWSTYPQSMNVQYCYDYDDFNQKGHSRDMPPIWPVIHFLRWCAKYGILAICVTGRAANKNQADMTSSQIAHLGLVPGRDYFAGLVGDVPLQKYNGIPIQSIRGVFMNAGKDTRNTEAHVSATDYKIATRCWIQKHGLPGYNQQIRFIASIGDQFSDSNGSCSGLKIKLPNPQYFLP